MLGTGACLLIDTNIDKGGYLQAHLFVIILDCEEHTRNTIILYVQTVGSPKAVWTTILIPGDHEFIKHESHTEYRQAQIFSVDDLDQMILVGTAHPMAHWLEVVGDVGSSGLKEIPDEEREMFDAEVKLIRESQEKVIANHHTARRMTERAKAQSLLLKAEMVEIALGMKPELFEAESCPASFSEKAVLGLQRHRAPWAALLQKAYEPGLSPVESDPYFQQIAGNTRESLKARMAQLTQEARKVVQVLSRL